MKSLDNLQTCEIMKKVFPNGKVNYKLGGQSAKYDNLTVSIVYTREKNYTCIYACMLNGEIHCDAIGTIEDDMNIESSLEEFRKSLEFFVDIKVRPRKW